MSQSVIAAQLYSVRAYSKTQADINAMLKKIRAIGYQAVQISGFGQYDAAETAKVLAAEGLACCSTHTAWSRFVTEIDKVILEHRLWGCVHPAIGGMPGEFRSAEGVVKFAREMEMVGKRLAEEGMDFSYHNHNFEFQKADGKTWLELMYDNCDPRYVKTEIDTYWVQAGGGEPAVWIRKYAGRMPIIHFKDMTMGPEGQRMAEVGLGNLNWPAILAAARDAGVEWYCVEQDDCYERNPFDSLKISLGNLHKMGLK
jgi:sugar phosphate isomerase/epimerase